MNQSQQNRRRPIKGTRTGRNWKGDFEKRINVRFGHVALELAMLHPGQTWEIRKGKRVAPWDETTRQTYPRSKTGQVTKRIHDDCLHGRVIALNKMWK